MREKIIVIHPVLSSQKGEVRKFVRHPDAALEEAIGLAGAIDLEIVHSEIIKLQKATPATLIGKGSVERIAEMAKLIECGLVFVDYALSPVQQRNLEKELNCKVIDRTGLILEIFGARARTKEGMLQVELAALSFQRSRLVKAWSHLERQRGGTGNVGGPGETQKELDRRILDDKIVRLKADLEKVKKNRRLQREARKKEPYPIVAIVGYTNAGKSTLFNRITGAEVFAKDLLFATLDTTMRGIEMPSGRKAILSDTVGFISDLPTHLVAAFRATLEEVQDAAIILHVRDISQPNTDAEKEDVLAILRDLGINTEHDPRIIEVMNKVDLLPGDEGDQLLKRAARSDNLSAVSALSGAGIDRLLTQVDAKLSEQRNELYVAVDISDGKALSWLYQRSEVLERHDNEQHAILKVGIDPADCDRFALQFPYKMQKTKPKEKRQRA